MLDNVHTNSVRITLRFLVLHIIAPVAIIIALILSPDTYSGNAASVLIYPYCLLAVAICLWALWSWRTTVGPLFNPYIIFFVTAWIFNAGQTLLEVLHLNDSGLLGGIFPPEIMLSTIQLAILGLVSLHVGALIGSLGTYHAPGGLTRPVRATTSGPSGACIEAIRGVGWTLFGVSIIPTIWRIHESMSVVWSSGYMGLYQQQDATGVNNWPAILASYFVPSAILIMLASRGRGITFLVSLVGILLYSTSNFVLGGRALATMPTIAYTWTYHRSVRKLPMAVIAGCAAFLLFVVFPFVRATRNDSGGLGSQSSLYESYTSIDNPAIAIISEMGGSMNTIAYTLELVPIKRPFDMGVGYFYALSTLMPNLFWDVHPNVARKDAGTWLTWEVDPGMAVIGGRLGYSCIAEAYLNFGWTGTPVILFLIGFGLGKLSGWVSKSDDPSKIAMAACTLSFLPLFARGEIYYIIRPIVWYSLLPYGAVLLLARCRRKGGARALYQVAKWR